MPEYKLKDEKASKSTKNGEFVELDNFEDLSNVSGGQRGREVLDA